MKVFLLSILSVTLLGGLVFSAAAEPKHSEGLIAEGTKWETSWFSTDSGLEGPAVLISGGIHGNEPAGAAAANQIRHWPVKKGRLIVVPEMNRLALAAKTRRTPDLEKDVSDLNRVFPKTESPQIPDFTTVATFVTEVAENGSPEGIQIGSPAILKGEFGDGCVVLISPHPEQTDGLRQIVPRLIEWSAGK